MLLRHVSFSACRSPRVVLHASFSTRRHASHAPPGVFCWAAFRGPGRGQRQRRARRSLLHPSEKRRLRRDRPDRAHPAHICIGTGPTPPNPPSIPVGSAIRPFMRAGPSCVSPELAGAGRPRSERAPRVTRHVGATCHAPRRRHAVDATPARSRGACRTAVDCRLGWGTDRRAAALRPSISRPAAPSTRSRSVP